MKFLTELFAWWTGNTIGTRLFTWRFGTRVGEDGFGNVYFQTGQQTRKARNLEVNPACTLSTSLAGIDLVFEGLAERITDGPTLEAIAAVWREGGWAAEVSGDGIVAPYNAPGTGPPPWQVNRVAAHTVFGVATAEPYGATRWQF